MKSGFILTAILSCSLLASCASQQSKKEPLSAQPLSSGHIQQATDASKIETTSIPSPVMAPPLLPPPTRPRIEEKFSAVVLDVPAKEFLFSLARESEYNVDIDPRIVGDVTLNAVDQTLPQILKRVANQLPIRYSIHARNIVVERDQPYQHNYQVDYVNMTRTSESTVNLATQIGSTGGSGIDGSAKGGNNNSSTIVTNTAENAFWSSLEANLQQLVIDDRWQAPETPEPAAPQPQEQPNLLQSALAPMNQAETPSPTEPVAPVIQPRVVVNRETGTIAVTATEYRHKAISEFIQKVASSAKRQVLIEATIAEIQLKDQYQAGIEWNLFDPTSDRINIVQQVINPSLVQENTFSQLILSGDDDKGKILQTTISALEHFGDVKVLSSPKIMSLNNQTSILKVVDNLVYFTIEVETEESTRDSQGDTTTSETTIHTVPVGFVMSVTPQISQSGQVTLNLRPTISRVIGRARDPNPLLAQLEIVNEVPIVQVREMESTLSIRNGDTAIMGGLMQDDIQQADNSVPILSDIPYLGKLFEYKEDIAQKSELVIFLRPVIIEQASLEQDLKSFKTFLPQQHKANRVNFSGEPET